MENIRDSEILAKSKKIQGNFIKKSILRYKNDDSEQIDDSRNN